MCTKRHLAFLGCRLFREGHVNRSDQMDQFGVPVSQAPTHLSRYLGFAPDITACDRSVRSHLRGSDLKPRFLEPDASSNLAQLHSLADGTVDRDDSRIAKLLPRAPASAPVRGSDLIVLRSAGRRHAPSRGDLSDVPAPVQHRAVLALNCAIPRRLLLGTRAEVMALDHGIRGGKAMIRVRRAHSHCAPKRLGLEPDQASKTPRDQQIFLVHREEIIGGARESCIRKATV
ncbi:hypothetical protein LNKW23_44630 [Paralimibaculum aggregatum]|uniref:DNA-binding transcriptional repressor CapW winged helix-turn-helix domain-containing protein n=1 Tax=Paralimibaculum aggregatum TaxID=3036245 RepID=A0ABQ6LT50_9RHOB|nr:hypothetical protein LNKW23_44630 [Limibaculum sp. NKW23]